MKKNRLLAVLLSVILAVSGSVPLYASTPEYDPVEAYGAETGTEEAVSYEAVVDEDGVVRLTSPSNADPEEKKTVSENITISKNTVSKNTVSEDSTVSVNNALRQLSAVSGVQRKPVLLDEKTGLFGMVRGQKWLAGKGVVTSNKKILKVNKKGFVTAKNPGEAEVSVGGMTYKIKVVYTYLSEKKLTLQVGENKKVSLQNNIEGFPVTWITANANVAQVADGTIYATGKGKTTVTAFVGGKPYTVRVRVKDKGSTTYLMNTPVKKASKIAVPRAKLLTWSPSANSAKMAEELGVSENAAMQVTIDKGKLTAEDKGFSHIGGSDGHALRVYGNIPTLRTDTGLAKAGKTNQYTLKMVVGDRFLLDFPDNHELPKWTSSNPQVASVNEFGLVYADSKGTTKLKTKTAGKKITVIITVGDESSVISGNTIIRKQLVDNINGNKTVYIVYDPATGEYKEVEYIIIDPNDPNSLIPVDGEVYDVDFDSNGGNAVASQEVAKGGKAVRPEDPARDGFVFDGWLKEGFLYNFNEPVYDDTTLIADWYDEKDIATRKQFVVLDANGGKFADGSEFLIKKLPKNSLLDIAAISPVWDGYSFLGWFYYNGNPATNSDTVTSDITVYAHWRNNVTGEIISTAKPLILFDDAHGGMIVRRANDNGTVTAPTVTWDGHRFDYWLYPDGSAYMPEDIFIEPAVLTAHWTKTGRNSDGTYNIVYNLCGGVNDPANPYTYTSKDEFDIKNPTKDGNVFTGWLVYIDGIRQGDGTDTSVKIFKGTIGHIILVANWVSGKYSLSFNSMGGNKIAPRGLQFDQEFGPLPTPSKQGYDFGGWFYSTEDNAREALETDTMPATNLTLYATWTENEFMSYTITYDLNDADSNIKATLSRPRRDYTKNDSGFYLATPEREGYEFLGWTGTGIAVPDVDAFVPRGSTGNRSYKANWSGYVNPIFTITYDLGDEGSELKAVLPNAKYDYTKNSDGFYLSNPTRYGYFFVGWSGTGIPEGKTNKDVFVPRGSTGNREYVATWESEDHDITDHPYSNLTFNLGERDGANVDSITYALSGATTGNGTLRNGEALRMLTGTSVMLFAPTNGDNAYYNDFWSSEETDPESGEGRIFMFRITQDTVVTLDCEKNLQYFTYDIDYDLAGGWFNKSVPKASYTIKTPAFTIGEPTKTGYTFLGWTGTDLDPVAMPKTFTVSQGSTGNRTYAANWSGANTYDLRFNPNGGTCSMQKKSVEFGQAYGTLPTPSWTHYDFQGWYTAATGGDKVTNATVMDTEGATVYAHWSPVEYTLTYNANGGSVTPATKKIKYGQTYGTLPTPSRSYCQHTGWFTAASGGDQVTSASVMAGNTTIYAHWLGQEVTVTFNANGGSVGTTSKKVNYAASYGDLPTPVWAHHDFAGWYTAASGGTKITSSSQVSSTTNHSLYAHWTGTTYKITYNANGGSGSIAQQSLTYGNNVTLANATDIMFRSGYKVTCWNTAANGTGTDYAFGASATFSDNTTLYAKWVACPTITISGTHNLTNMRVYTSSSAYKDYTTYTNIPVTAGQIVLFYHANRNGAWSCGPYELGKCEEYYIMVPASASGGATVTMSKDNYKDQFTATTGWAANGNMLSGAPLSITGHAAHASSGCITSVTVLDRFGQERTYERTELSKMICTGRITIRIDTSRKWLKKTGDEVPFTTTEIGTGVACRAYISNSSLNMGGQPSATLKMDVDSSTGNVIWNLTQMNSTEWVKYLFGFEIVD